MNYYKKLRLEQNLTIKELAKALGQQESEISRYENGKIPPPPHIVARYLGVLGGNRKEYLKLYLEHKERLWKNKVMEEMRRK